MKYLLAGILLVAFMASNIQANVEAGWDAYRKGKWVEAILAFRRVLKDDPKSLPAHAGLASAMYALSRFDEVMTVFPDEIKKGNIDLNSRSEDAFTILKMIGFACFRNKQSKKAIVALSVAIKIKDDDPAIYNTLGLAYLNTGSSRLSEIAFRTAVNLDDKNPVYMNNLGASYIDQKMYKDALSCFEKAVRLDPRYQNGWDNVWMGREKLGLPAMRGQYNYSYFSDATEDEKKQKSQGITQKSNADKKRIEPVQHKKHPEEAGTKKEDDLKKKQDGEKRKQDAQSGTEQSISTATVRTNSPEKKQNAVGTGIKNSGSTNT